MAAGALTVAVEFGHDDIARLILERGADPTWPELNADRGGALHAAARAGNRALVELLLAHGADPNAHSDSGGNSVFAAKTPEHPRDSRGAWRDSRSLRSDLDG